MAMTGNEEEDMQRIIMEMELKQKEIRIEEMEAGMMESTTKFARDMADFKHTIMLLDAQLSSKEGGGRGIDGFENF